MGSHDESEAQGSAGDQFVFPQETRQEAVQEESEQLVTLCLLPSKEAIDLCARLESNGIPCERFWAEDTSDANSTERLVDVRVPAPNLGAAQLICDGHEPALTESDREFEAQSFADRIDAFICPICKKQTLVNARLSPGMATARNWLLFLMVLPVVIAFFNNVSPNTFGGVPAEMMAWGLILWGIFALIALILVVVAHRPKLCPECGWRGDASN